MFNKMNEKVYDQIDMDTVLVELSKAKREAELSHQLLWAVVQSAGGHIAVPYSLWTGDPNREIIMWDDPITYDMHLQVLLFGENGGNDVSV